MPCLKSVEFGYNRLVRLSGSESSAIPPHSTLQSLNLDSNSLSDWVHVCSSLAVYDRYFVDLISHLRLKTHPNGNSLQQLVLTSNVIETIPFPDEPHQHLSLLGLQYLSLSENRIASWSSLDALSIWMPDLKSLLIRGNPLVTGGFGLPPVINMSSQQFVTGSDEKHARSFIIARISSLVTLDGTRVRLHVYSRPQRYLPSSWVCFLDFISRANGFGIVLHVLYYSARPSVGRQTA